MEQMNIDRAIEILNRERWRGFDCWRAVTWRELALNEEPVWADTEDRDPQPSLATEDAIAIASWLELRQAVEPFVKAAQDLSSSYWDSDVLDGIAIRDWRKLAQIGGEK